MSTFYSLNNGTYWDVDNTCFVTSIPEYANISLPVTDKYETPDIEGLRKCLRYNNLPLGELKEDVDFASEVRNERNKRLSETDYLAMYDYPIGDNKEAVLYYRQALRDITKQEEFPRNVIWPEKTW